jgi:OOP family OmpA-OmpF porin
MNKKLLCAALLGGLGVAQAASAQEFDDRWYITGSAGMNIQDNDRGTGNAPFGAIGFGKFFNPNWSFDVELNYQNPKGDDARLCGGDPRCSAQDLNWSQYGISFDLRRHFVAEGRSWNPYLLAGLGYQREEIETGNAAIAGEHPIEDEEGAPALKLGVGLQGDVGRVGIRTELAYRAVGINDTRAQLLLDDPFPERNDGEDWYGDVLASVGIIVPLGPEPEAPVAPAPVAPNCADSDSDGDGVNDCDDKCPGSQAGQTIGPDGCPVPVSIDLKGVNFDFDKSTLRPDAIAILNEAIEILKRYPDLRVEVAGHTDLCGTDEYNQGLSERRSRAVYDYLTSNGIDAARLVGPNGYGESRPLEQTEQTLPGCKSETNRRTELNVQN